MRHEIDRHTDYVNGKIKEDIVIITEDPFGVGAQMFRVDIVDIPTLIKQLQEVLISEVDPTNT